MCKALCWVGGVWQVAEVLWSGWGGKGWCQSPNSWSSRPSPASYWFRRHNLSTAKFKKQ